MPLFDTPDEDALPVTISVRLPKRMWVELDEIATRETELPISKKLGVRYSRNDTIQTMLRKQIARYWDENPRGAAGAHPERPERRKPGGSRKTREEHYRALQADHGKTEK